MVENLSFVLIGLSGVVGILTFIGAHNSPIPMPNISKAGCTVAVGMLLAGFAMGMYPPVSHFNQCASSCSTALQDMESEAHGDFDVHVSPARVAYKACHKGAEEADEKAKQVSVEQNDPSLYKPVDPAVIEERCMSQAQDRCTVSCFEVR